jgi:hypothetical protein
MNPIPEEDEFESLSLSASHRSDNTAKFKIVSEGNLESYEDHFLQSTETINSDLLKQWLEYRTEANLESSRLAQVNSSSIEMFPNIVRGLDIEQATAKYGSGKDFEDLLSVKLARKEGIARGNTFTGSEASQNSCASPKNDLLDELDPSISYSFSPETSLSIISRSPKHKDTRINFRDEEELILDLHNKIEELTGNSLATESSEKKGFWGKFGFSSKKRDDDVFSYILNLWQVTEKEYYKAKFQTEETKNKLMNLQDRLISLELDNHSFDDKLQDLRRKIAEERLSVHKRNENLIREIQEASEIHETLCESLHESQIFYAEKGVEGREREERWNMRLEDIRVQLTETLSHKEISYFKATEIANIMQKIESEKEYSSLLNQQIELAMNLYTESCEYFDLSEDAQCEMVIIT